VKRLRLALILAAVLHSALAIELETFTAKRSGQTLGIDFSIDYPKEWTGRRPTGGATVASFWSTPSGMGDSMALIVPHEQNLNKRDVTKADFEPHFENPLMEKTIGAMLPGAVFLKKKFLADYKFPAGYLDYELKLKLPTGQQRIRVRNYIIYLRKVMLQVQFYLVQDDGPNRLAIFADEMQEIVDSLKLLSDSDPAPTERGN
jgi:hypothetical protein